MNWGALIEGILNQDIFSGLVIFASAAALYRADVAKTLPVLFWAAGYFSTQIPLKYGWGIKPNGELVMQSLVSLSLIFFYFTVPRTKYIVFAAICECVYTLVNAAWAFADEIIPTLWHPWYRWAIICVLNYASFISLCLNKWRAPDHERRSRESDNRLDYFVGYVRYLHGIIRKNASGGDKWKG